MDLQNLSRYAVVVYFLLDDSEYWQYGIWDLRKVKNEHDVAIIENDDCRYCRGSLIRDIYGSSYLKIAELYWLWKYGMPKTVIQNIDFEFLVAGQVGYFRMPENNGVFRILQANEITEFLAWFNDLNEYGILNPLIN